MQASTSITRAIYCLLFCWVICARVASAAGSSEVPAISALGYVAGKTGVMFIGSQAGQPVRMLRSAEAGRGRWDIFTGTLNDRVRLRFLDGEGLREVLALDSGYRIILSRIGNERTEYRFYDGQARFLIGAVLFRSQRGWQQGLMREEIFPGYGRLESIQDVTAAVNRQASPLAVSLWQRFWRSIRWITPAHAAGGDFASLLQGLDGDDRALLGAAGDQMLKAGLVGLSAFTIKLIGTSESLVAGGALVAAGPFLVAAGAGVAVGLAADKVRNWVDARNLDGVSGMFGLYSQLTAESLYGRSPAPWPKRDSGTVTAQSTNPASSGVSNAGSDVSSLLALSDQLDRLDSGDFESALDRASGCTKSRDFSCAEKELGKAKKIAVGDRNRKSLISAWERLDGEKKQKAREDDDKRREAERVAALERRRQAEAENSGFQWGKFAALAGGALIAKVPRLPAEQQSKVLNAIIQDSMPGSQGAANTLALGQAARLGRGGANGAGDDAATKRAKAKACANEYKGPEVDPQLDTLCKLAAFDACLHRTVQVTDYDAEGRRACKNLNDLLQTAVSAENRKKYNCGYCPYPY
jgi:hypothetical protein